MPTLTLDYIIRLTRHSKIARAYASQKRYGFGIERFWLKFSSIRFPEFQLQSTCRGLNCIKYLASWQPSTLVCRFVQCGLQIKQTLWTCSANVCWWSSPVNISATEHLHLFFCINVGTRFKSWYYKCEVGACRRKNNKKLEIERRTCNLWSHRLYISWKETGCMYLGAETKRHMCGIFWYFSKNLKTRSAQKVLCIGFGKVCKRSKESTSNVRKDKWCGPPLHEALEEVRTWSNPNASMGGVSHKIDGTANLRAV